MKYMKLPIRSILLSILWQERLLQRVRETRFLPAETLQRSSQSLLLALNHLHQFNIAHRDLKPENLLLKSDENNYDNILGDFGIVIL
ncbi:unnamed protein product [Paramecium sonneborni]|uniref:Protein kinase domain-containing protein n=1 Tax=Paramecium sonneborni TaxID=65129 RepID=A0A8S1RSY0_9CILI|nr:unnamed protein product [Paramecium sonneborni]